MITIKENKEAQVRADIERKKKKGLWHTWIISEENELTVVQDRKTKHAEKNWMTSVQSGTREGGNYKYWFRGYTKEFKTLEQATRFAAKILKVD